MDLITPAEIYAEIAGEKTPYWIGGQQICCLRDLDWKEVADNRKLVLHMIKEAYEVRILIYDSQRHIWSLNSNFGDVMDWMPRRREIMRVIYEASDKKMDTSD
jgi:hypothetical protein